LVPPAPTKRDYHSESPAESTMAGIARASTLSSGVPSD